MRMFTFNDFHFLFVGGSLFVQNHFLCIQHNIAPLQHFKSFVCNNINNLLLMNDYLMYDDIFGYMFSAKASF